MIRRAWRVEKIHIAGDVGLESNGIADKTGKIHGLTVKCSVVLFLRGNVARPSSALLMVALSASGLEMFPRIAERGDPRLHSPAYSFDPLAINFNQQLIVEGKMVVDRTGKHTDRPGLAWNSRSPQTMHRRFQKNGYL